MLGRGLLQAETLIACLRPYNNMVIIYSTPTCIYCNSLKEYLAQHHIQYQEIDVASNEKELEKMVAISGQMGVPVVDIEGNIVIGFDKQKIDELLKLK